MLYSYTIPVLNYFAPLYVYLFMYNGKQPCFYEQCMSLQLHEINVLNVFLIGIQLYREKLVGVFWFFYGVDSMTLHEEIMITF